MNNTDLFNILNNDNTNKIKYVIIFFIFIIGLSENLFTNLFGKNIKIIFKNIYVKHSLTILFLFLLLDVNNENSTSDAINPIINLLYSIIIYILVILLLHCNKIYIAFTSIIVIILIILNKFKSYFETTINDQEILQTQLDLIYKTNNVFVIIIILTIIIGSLTSLDKKHFYNTILGKTN
tara:strand:- start:7201 stop:7740 length:540 start_codon:yes stop_codon:yes gene_type:complete